MSTDDIRRAITLLETQVETSQVVAEAEPMGVRKTLGTFAKSLISNVAKGELETGFAANKLYHGYQKHIGQKGIGLADSTVRDVYNFLTKAKFSPELVQKVIADNLGVQPAEVQQKAHEAFDKSKMGPTFLQIVQKSVESDDTEMPAAVDKTAPAAGSTTPILKDKLGNMSVAAQAKAIDKIIKAIQSAPLEEIDFSKMAKKAKELFTKTVPEPAAKPAAGAFSIDTGDADLDTYIKQLVATKGKKGAIKALMAYKNNLVATSDPFEQLKGELKKLAGIEGKKVLPQKFVDSIRGDLAKLAKGDKESGTYAADKIIKYAKVGYDVRDLTNQWIGNAKAGERFLSLKEHQELTALLEEFGLTWESLGLVTRIDESITDHVLISRIEN